MKQIKHTTKSPFPFTLKQSEFYERFKRPEAKHNKKKT
jgi:hypothetical protein